MSSAETRHWSISHLLHTVAGAARRAGTVTGSRENSMAGRITAENDTLFIGSGGIARALSTRATSKARSSPRGGRVTAG